MFDLPAEGSPQRSDSSAEPCGELDGLRVLAAERNAASRRALCEILAGLGCKVDQADSLDEMFDKIRGRPDERDAVVLENLHKARIFRQKAVSRMDRIGAGDFARRQ